MTIEIRWGEDAPAPYIIMSIHYEWTMDDWVSAYHRLTDMMIERGEVAVVIYHWHTTYFPPNLMVDMPRMRDAARTLRATGLMSESFIVNQHGFLRIVSEMAMRIYDIDDVFFVNTMQEALTSVKVPSRSGRSRSSTAH